MALSVVIVVGENTPFMEALLKKVDEIDPVKDMGPLITNNSVININKHLENSLKQNSEIILDNRNKIPEKGFYMGHVIIKTNVNSDVYKNELFGPVLSVINCNNLENAISIINDNPYGNGTCLYSDSLEEITLFE